MFYKTSHLTGTDVELVSMLHDRLYNVLAIGAAVCTWNTCMRTLGKHVLQIQVEVFHTVATIA